MAANRKQFEVFIKTGVGIDQYAPPKPWDIWEAATKAAEEKFTSANKQIIPVCPGMEKCSNFGSCGDCVRHPILRDKWSAKPK